MGHKESPHPPLPHPLIAMRTASYSLQGLQSAQRWEPPSQLGRPFVPQSIP